MKFKFYIECGQCGYRDTTDSPGSHCLTINFKRGTHNIHDTMVIYCGRCGNTEEHVVVWPLDVVGHNKSVERDRANPTPEDVEDYWSSHDWGPSVGESV